MTTKRFKKGLVLLVLGPILALAAGFVVAIAEPAISDRSRRELECTVLVLQVAGVLALVASKLAPDKPWVSGVLLGIQLGLGVTGTLCARYGSDFALFAGATLGAVLVTVSTGEIAPDRPSSSIGVGSRSELPDTRGAATGVLGRMPVQEPEVRPRTSTTQATKCIGALACDPGTEAHGESVRPRRAGTEQRADDGGPRTRSDSRTASVASRKNPVPTRRGLPRLPTITLLTRSENDSRVALRAKACGHRLRPLANLAMQRVDFRRRLPHLSTKAWLSGHLV